jgi:phage virion morphogenesis protein
MAFNNLEFLDQKLQDTVDKLGMILNSVEILDEAGAVLLNRIRTRFLAETAPDGTKWPESEAARKRRAKGGTGTLFNTGRLFHSIQLSGDGEYERRIGTDVTYGVYHNLGTGRLPQRVFLGFSPSDEAVALNLVVKRVKEAFE